MNTRDAVANRIIKLCAERNLAINALARISAVPPSTLKNIINGESEKPRYRDHQKTVRRL